MINLKDEVLRDRIMSIIEVVKQIRMDDKTKTSCWIYRAFNGL